MNTRAGGRGGEAETVWVEVLEDTRHGRLKRGYDGGWAEVNDLAAAGHDLLPERYAFGAIQTTRGCPLNCNFCSVTTFNGAYANFKRQRRHAFSANCPIPSLPPMQIA